MTIDITLLRATEALISQQTHQTFVAESQEIVGGGCINRCYRLGGGQRDFFVKTNTIDRLGTLQAERVGLLQLAAARCLRVPRPLFCTELAATAVLVLEYLPISASASATGWEALGSALARLHNCPLDAINARLSPEHRLPEGVFGTLWNTTTLGNEPGFIGTDSDWAACFCRHRLAFQFDQVERRHDHSMDGRDEILALGREMLAHRPAVSLTHGDLWGGNAGFTDGAPLVFDPAPYLADAETDLAMTELFGGFSPPFYTAYQRERPLDPGYQQRRELYNLYHVLNHYNLFGGHYRDWAEQSIARLLSGNR